MIKKHICYDTLTKIILAKIGPAKLFTTDILKNLPIVKILVKNSK